MAEAVSPSPGGLPAARHDPVNMQRIAWSAILIAFGVFCIICMVLGVGMNFFLYRSMITLPAVLVVGRGTVGVTGPDQIETVVRNQREIFNSIIVSTDSQSQATISFLDPMAGRRLVAALTVKKNTSFDLESVSRPRFDFSDEAYSILLEDLDGALDIFVPNGLNRPLRLNLGTSHATWVIISEPGQYTVRVSATDIQVENLAGRIAIVETDARAQGVPIGQRGIWYAADGAFAVTSTYINLLENPSFEQTNIAETVTLDGSVTLRELPLTWGCADQPHDIPAGDYSVAWLDGRAALQLQRGEGANSHGETFCLQSFGPPETPGRNLSSFDYLTVRATFKIAGHSLSACGVAGSECPLMLQITYLDAFGRRQNWYHGFYTHIDPALNYPLSCNSCRQEHDIINPNTWYTYESDNLFAALPALERPQSIQEVRVYASGHEYNVYISQVALLAGTTALPTPAEALGG